MADNDRKVTIHNPISDVVETIDQAELNRYLSMTNGEAMNWIVNSELNSNLD